VLFSCCDCTITAIRRKEDPWNAIASGAATGGILAARAGLKAAGRSAVVGGVILAAIEGLNIVVVSRSIVQSCFLRIHVRSAVSLHPLWQALPDFAQLCVVGVLLYLLHQLKSFAPQEYTAASI
jgi:hypothetical protein